MSVTYFWNAGLFVFALVGFLFPNSWRWLTFVCGALSVAFAPLALMAEESPRWLVSRRAIGLAGRSHRIEPRSCAGVC